MSVFNSRNYQATASSTGGSISINQIKAADGTSLQDTIANLVLSNQTEDMLLQNVPTITGNNEFTGSNQFDNPIQYKSTVGVGSITNSKHLASKEYVDASLNTLRQSVPSLSGANEYTGSNLFDSPVSYASNIGVGSITNAKHLSTKEYVDTSLNTLRQSVPSLSGANEYTGSNLFDSPVLYASNIGVGSITNAKHLPTKEYVDGNISGLRAGNNTWSGTNTFVAGALQLGKIDDSTVITVYGNSTFDRLPLMSADLTVSDNKQLAPKKYVDDSISAQKGSTNIWTAQNTFNNNVTLGNSNGANTVQQYGSFAIHGPTTLDNVPILATDLTASVTDDKHLANKKYVDSSITTLKASNSTWLGQNNFSTIPTIPTDLAYGNTNQVTNKFYVDQLVASAQNTSYTGGLYTTAAQTQATNTLFAPNLGTTNTAANSTGAATHTFYIAFSGNSSQLNTAVVSFDIVYTFGNNITSGVTVNADNSVTKITPFVGNELTLFKQLATTCLFQLSVKPDANDVYVKGISQTTLVYNNGGLSTNGTYALWTNTYGGNVMKWYPIQFQWVDKNKIRVVIGGPLQRNNPSVAGVMSSMQFKCTCFGDMASGGPGQNGAYFTNS
jgi:hypothetical protein